MKYKLLILGLILFCSISCSKVVDRLTTFTFDRETSFTIPSATSIGLPVVLNTPDVESSFESELTNNDTDLDLVEYIKLKSLSNEITTPLNGNFNFIKDIEISISADGLNDALVASKKGIQNDNLSLLELDVEDLDLKPYLQKDKYTLKANITTDEVITQDYDIKTAVRFEVKAKLKN